MLRRPHIFAGVIATAVSAVLAGNAGAQTDGPRPTTAPTLLEQLDRDTRSVYRKAQNSIVHVKLQTPIAFNDLFGPGHPLAHWSNRLDPAVVQQLQKHESENLTAAEPHRVNALVVEPTTQPVVPQIQFTAQFVASASGVIFDDRGHFLMPLFIEKRPDARPVNVLVNNQLVQAQIVGSDRQTGLTVLQLQEPRGAPLKFASNRLNDGTLVVMFDPNNEDAHLVVWTGPRRQGFSMIVGVDGSFAGFERDGRLISASVCRTIAQQIIDNGSVPRAFLGVRVREIGPGDPARQQLALGRRAAVRVEQVLPDSAAQHAGVQPGDLILAIADQSVDDGIVFSAAMSKCNGTTCVQVLRNGEVMELSAELKPKNEQ